MLVHDLGHSSIYRLQKIALKYLSGETKTKAVHKLNIIRNRYFPDIFDADYFLNYVSEKKTGFIQNIGSIEHLALRASTADYSFYPDNWPGSYNLGLTSSDLYFSYKLYEIYRKKLRKLQDVILFYSVSANGYSMIMTIEKYRAVAYKYFFDIPYQCRGRINKKLEKRILNKCDSIRIAPVENSYKGYKRQTIFMSIKPEERVKTHLRENQREPDQLKWLIKLYKSLHDDGRKLIVVIPPFRSDYTASLPEKSVIFKKLHNSNLGETEIIDLYDSLIFTDSDFGDTDHLNEKGAIKLTNELYWIMVEKRLI